MYATCNKVTFIASAADGAKSLKDRETREMAVVRADQEKRHSRFSSLRQTTIKCNSSQEANAMVLAKWAADENHIVATTEGDGVRENAGGDQNALATNKTGMFWCSFFLIINYCKSLFISSTFEVGGGGA